MPVEIGQGFEPSPRRGEILLHLDRIDPAEKLGAFLIVAGIAADRGQPVGGEGDEIGERQTPGHILDVWVEPTIFVDNQDRRQFVGAGGPDQIALDAAVALRGRDGHELGDNPAVIGLDLDRPRVIGPQHLEQRRGADALGSVLLRAIEEAPAGYAAVHIGVEDVQEFLGKVRRLFSLHESLPDLRCRQNETAARRDYVSRGELSEN